MQCGWTCKLNFYDTLCYARYGVIHHGRYPSFRISIFNYVYHTDEYHLQFTYSQSICTYLGIIILSLECICSISDVKTVFNQYPVWKG